MDDKPSDVAFTPSVKRLQMEKGSRKNYEQMEETGGWATVITPELATFLAGLDMFYLGTANSSGQPYVQYRGGSPGFLRVVDERTLGFADFGGNRQYITLGNLSENPKAFIFLMDYTRGRRVKIWGEASVVENDPALLESLRHGDHEGIVERAIIFRITAWDVNCRQHIHLRYPRAQVALMIEELKGRVRQLEEELRVLRKDVSPNDLK